MKYKAISTIYESTYFDADFRGDDFLTADEMLTSIKQQLISFFKDSNTVKIKKGTILVKKEGLFFDTNLNEYSLTPHELKTYFKRIS